tara:strand:- start:59874 stop:61106 length:1233 start_codon:yes stop_codon:yes gene_type:complete
MKRLLLFTFCFAFQFVIAQTDSGDLESYLNTHISNMPGDSGNDYKTPSNAELTTWENCINALLSSDIVTARAQADLVNYRIVEYTNTALSVNKDYYVLEEKSTQTNYWGVFVFAKNSIRSQLVIQAPHSSFDFNTGKESVYSFVRLNNKALFLNGTHRCNHLTASTCAGTTTVCSGGASEAFKISDMAHNSDSIWQKTTEILYNNTNAVFIQLHGFTKQASDPYVILSNGTDQTPTIDYATMIKNELLNQDNTLTFKLAHIDSWTRLVGFTNTQGRLINDSTNPCSTSATMTTGRFIHIEQEKSKLRQDAAGWEKMHQTLGIVFGATLSVKENNSLEMLSKNPFKDEIRFSADNVKRIAIYSLQGKEIKSIKNLSNKSNFTIDTRLLSHGIYILKVTTDKGIVSKKLVRE